VGEIHEEFKELFEKERVVFEIKGLELLPGPRDTKKVNYRRGKKV